uniref:Uncharacterized protein n=1 Tax=viral metagenome TaxID=1070528 RepID=A0A6C0EQ20_9ZZZZ
MVQIAIINRSSVVSDKDGSTITNALNIILPQFCKDWSIVTTTCVYVEKGKTTTIPLKIALLDTSDEEGAVAYHDQINDNPYGRAFAKTVLDNGGVMLYSLDPTVPTFAQSVCHELFEMLINPGCNIWAMFADEVTMCAYEVSDPVQSNALTVQVRTGSSRKGKFFATPVYTKVGICDWVLPNWFDPQSKTRPFNHNNTLTAPLTVDKNGYILLFTNGSYDIIWGKSILPVRKDIIKAKFKLSEKA